MSRRLNVSFMFFLIGVVAAAYAVWIFLGHPPLVFDHAALASPLAR